MTTSKIILSINYKNNEYKIKGLIWELGKVTKCHFGYSGDEYPCIMIEFDREAQEITMFRLRAQKFGGWRNDNRAICMKPKLPEKGALDLLVMTGLAFVEKFIGKVQLKLEDMAMVEDNYPLSWLKFWDSSKSGLYRTTYGKYGFVSRNKKNSNLTKEEAIKVFDKYLLFVSNNLKRQIPSDIKNKMKIYGNYTFESYLKKIFETRKYESELNKLQKLVPNFEYNYTVNGSYYLNWNIYNEIPNKVDMKILKLKSI